MRTALFTDLDGTILFSKRTLPEHLTEKDCVKAETYSNGGYGLMEEKLVAFLEEWQQKNLLIPVTTRSTEQFERLGTVWKRIPVPYALASNGGNLYRDGVLDENWNKKVRANLAVELSHKEAVLSILNVILPQESIRKIKDIDGLYYCILVMERSWEQAFINEVNAALAVYDWMGYFQHKKLYFLPKRLSKEQAVKMLLTELSEELVCVGLGDTDMDQQMLLECDRYLYFGEEEEREKLSQSIYSQQVVKDLLLMK